MKNTTSTLHTLDFDRLPDPLTRDEERALGRRIRDHGDPDAVDELVRANLRFVVNHVGKFQGLGVDRDDLIAAGAVGLIRAARKFDPERGVKFISYAVWWIRQACFQEIAEQGRPVRIPQSAHAKMMGDDGPDPDLRHLNFTPLRIDHPAPSSDEDGDRTPAETVLGPDPDPEPDAVAEDDETRAAVREAVDRLDDPRLAFVARRYYGIADGEPWHLEQIGEVLGVTKERVRQLRDEALAQLRDSGALSGLAE